jgi:hypothetical protein
MAVIRSTATEVAKETGCTPDLDGLRMALQADPSILLGGGSAPAKPSDLTLLRNLAEGTLNQESRRQAVDLMCRSNQALSYFSNVLQSNGRDSCWNVDPALDGVGARLRSCIEKFLENLTPVGLRQRVSSLMTQSFGDTLRSISADGGTMWWLEPGEAVLEAVFNPLESEFAGKRQPLASGIISLVIATSETVRIGAADSHFAHSPAIDSLLGKTTQSMIAVPLRILDRTYGVLTAVRLESSEIFNSKEEQVIERQAEVLSEMLTTILIREISGCGS